MADYLPRTDADFNNWQTNFTDYVTEHASELGVSETEIKQLLAARVAWEDAYRQHLSAQAAASSATAHKETSREAWATLIRGVVKRIQTNPATTNAQRAALGITIPDTISTPAGPPTSRPVARVETRDGLRQTVHFVDETTPTRLAKPAGVIGAEVWVYVGDTAPADPEAMSFLGLDTRTPYEAKFDPEDGGKTAFYRLRWVNRKGEQGDWSAIASGAIAP